MSSNANDQQVVYWKLEHDYESRVTNLRISGDGGISWLYIDTYSLWSDYDTNRFRQALTIATLFLGVLNCQLQRHPDNFPTEMRQGFSAKGASE